MAAAVWAQGRGEGEREAALARGLGRLGKPLRRARLARGASRQAGERGPLVRLRCSHTREAHKRVEPGETDTQHTLPEKEGMNGAGGSGTAGRWGEHAGGRDGQRGRKEMM